jgi:hypothetical protein
MEKDYCIFFKYRKGWLIKKRKISSIKIRAHKMQSAIREAERLLPDLYKGVALLEPMFVEYRKRR